MRNYQLLTLLLPLARPALAWTTRSDGCEKPINATPGGPTQTITIHSNSQTGGGDRKYLIYVPENFSSTNNESAPLILAFPGQLMPAWSMELVTNLSSPYFNKDAIVVYPEGLDFQPPGQQWLGDVEAPPSSVIDDRVFANEIIDSVTSSFCIDESRIYASGVSNGGGLTGLLACSPTLNRRIAAFAAVAGAFYTDAALTEPLFGAGCAPELIDGRKLPILEMHGLNDTVIAYDGDNAPAPNSIPIPEWIDSWLDKNGCEGQVPKAEILDGGNVTKSTWSCDGWEDVVVHYRIDKFGHGWPSTSFQGDVFEQLRLTSTTWNATTVMLDWFSKWKLLE
ncbi:Alpha/Beta hydrolase protein [Dendryphion nanum]|uniref:feruloyl esterase n=1 Tax=Dendryphion nanum TaxID=256645 RepID=A0A9P9EK45_9PLEO|nr:Alpha/Beta hydrolase protein [Dendryphion nanum]